MLPRNWRGPFIASLVLAATAASAYAQDYSFDARRIGLGGAGGTPNPASKLVERQRPYRSILIPVGLVRVLKDVRVFYPNREDFDLSRVVEFSSSPFHFVFGRGEDLTAGSFFRDLVQARVNADLNAYRGDGFDPPLKTLEEGRLQMTWGHTFMLHQGDRSFQGIYVGAGPYLAARAHANFDAEFEQILNSTTGRPIRSATMAIGGGETDQLALDIAGSYRARFPLFPSDGAGASRNGMYVMASYHHLQGFRLDEFDAKLQLDTDTNGLLVPDPPEAPFLLEWNTSSKGVGLALDFGVTFVVNRWDFGVGVTGLANRIKWRDITEHDLVLVSLFGGSEFIHTKRPHTGGTMQLELPVTYTGDLAYHRDAWSAYTEYSSGLGESSFRAGLEYRFRVIELRGAGRYSQGAWYPSAGVGYNLTRSFGVDAAVYGTRTFLESEPHVGLALSFRFDRR